MSKSIETQLKEKIAGATPTLVEVYADWCPHCQRMMPVVEQLKERVGASANIVQVEGEQHPDVMQQLGVDSFPTWILFVSGREVWRNSGEMSLQDLANAIAQA